MRADTVLRRTWAVGYRLNERQEVRDSDRLEARANWAHFVPVGYSSPRETRSRVVHVLNVKAF